MSYLIKTTQPTSEPVSLSEAQLHLRLDTSGSPPTHPDDTLVQTLISASRESAENYANITVAQCQYQLKAEAIDDKVDLQTFPVTAIASVTYKDDAGATQTVSSSAYYINNHVKPSQLVFYNDAPSYEMTITFTAGFTDGEQSNPFPCPAGIKAAILLMLGNWYENRETVSNIESFERPQSAIYLLTPYRINMGT